MTAHRSEEMFHSKLFGLVAPALGWTPPIRYLLRRDRILRLLKKLPRGELIEVGCGAGALLDDFSRLGFPATGLETSPLAIALARALAIHADGAQQIVDGVDPAWDGTKHVVCAFDVLEHIEDDGAAIELWMRWLQPEGRLLLSVPAHQHRWNPGDEWAGHWRRYDRRDIVSLLESRGLLIEHLECYGFPLANLTELAGRKVYLRMIAERSQATSKAEATAQSGVERTDARELFNKVDTALGRAALRVCFMLQALTVRTDWGSGYLLLAKHR